MLRIICEAKVFVGFARNKLAFFILWECKIIISVIQRTYIFINECGHLLLNFLNFDERVAEENVIS